MRSAPNRGAKASRPDGNFAHGAVLTTLDELLDFRRRVLGRGGGAACDVAFLRGSQEEVWQKLLQLQFAPIRASSSVGWSERAWRPSDGRITTVDKEVAAGNKTCRVAGKKQRCRGDLLRAAEAAQQMLRAKRLPTYLKAAVALQCSLRLHASRRECVHPNVLSGMIDRHDFGELDQRSFGRTIGGAARAAYATEL